MIRDETVLEIERIHEQNKTLKAKIQQIVELIDTDYAPKDILDDIDRDMRVLHTMIREVLEARYEPQK